jgi:hypothetical protein
VPRALFLPAREDAARVFFAALFLPVFRAAARFAPPRFAAGFRAAFFLGFAARLRAGFVAFFLGFAAAFFAGAAAGFAGAAAGFGAALAAGAAAAGGVAIGGRGALGFGAGGALGFGAGGALGFGAGGALGFGAAGALGALDAGAEPPPDPPADDGVLSLFVESGVAVGTTLFTGLLLSIRPSILLFSPVGARPVLDSHGIVPKRARTLAARASEEALARRGPVAHHGADDGSAGWKRKAARAASLCG